MRIFTLSLLQIVYRKTRSAPKRVDESESHTSLRMHFISRSIGKLSSSSGSVFSSYTHIATLHLVSRRGMNTVRAPASVRPSFLDDRERPLFAHSRFSQASKRLSSPDRCPPQLTLPDGPAKIIHSVGRGMQITHMTDAASTLELGLAVEVPAFNERADRAEAARVR